MTFDLDAFVSAYAVCALWSSLDDDCEPLDANHGTADIADSTMARMREDCEDFAKSNAADLALYCERMKSEEWSGEAHAGHDFWLTRNGHGAGFWDRGLDDIGERLSEAAEVYVSVALYVCDDGAIHA